MKKVLLVSIMSIASMCFGQRYEYVYRNPLDSSFNCYLKYFPNTDTIRGLVVRDYSMLYDAKEESPYQFTDLALDEGMMVLITNTSRRFPELFTSDSTINLLDDIITEVVREHKIPEDKIFIGGISSSGTRALRYAQFCAQGKSEIKIRGVFVVDSPLDLERFYNSALHHQKNFKGGMLTESNLVLALFDSLFGGSPTWNNKAYQNASVFSHSDSSGGNAALLNNTDIIIFHEPDIDWWINERGCSYQDINSFDLAAFTVHQRQLGNEHIELITTSNKGYDLQGKRKPHSWSIVDEHYLMKWISSRIE